MRTSVGYVTFLGTFIQYTDWEGKTFHGRYTWDEVNDRPVLHWEGKWMPNGAMQRILASELIAWMIIN